MLMENYLALFKLGEENFRGLLSPLLFVIALLLLIHVLRETEMRYQLEKNGARVNHFLFTDDLKLYKKMKIK